MTDMMRGFACFNQSLPATVLHQLTVLAQAMVAMTGQVYGGHYFRPDYL